MGEATWCIQGALGSIGSERGGGRRGRRGGWRRTTTFPGCIVDFLRCGLWSPGGIKLERPVTLNLRCQKERTVGLLPPQGWPGRSMLVPEPRRALGLPWVQPVQLRELTCSENSHLEQT